MDNLGKNYIMAELSTYILHNNTTNQYADVIVGHIMFTTLQFLHGSDYRLQTITSPSNSMPEIAFCFKSYMELYYKYVPLGLQFSADNFEGKLNLVLLT